MKLPRYHNPTSSAAAADALARGREPDDHRLQNEGTPRAGNLGAGSTSTTHASMRRCQSAAASQQQRSRPGTHHRHHRGTNLHKSRSHSHGPVSSLHKLTTRAQPPTQELPIPSQRLHGYHHQASSLSDGADKTDLTRMYDYATWNMYERIVSARRRRLSEIDQQGSPTSSSGASSSRRASELDSSRDSSRDGVKSATAATGGSSKFATAKSTKQLLSKTSSADDSTLATADETDKSSTTSSSWSRTDSPHTYPGVAFNYVRDVSSCPPPGEHNKSRADDEHFIFELDM